jgi:hypothetical protein
MRSKLPLILVLLAAGLACRTVQTLDPRVAEPNREPSPVPEAGKETPETEPSGPPDPDQISADVLSQMAEIEVQVETLRGLNANSTVHRSLLTQQQLRQNVIDELLADYTDQEALDDAFVLSQFGLLVRDFPLHDFYIDLYSEGIAGYFDDEAQRMYVLQGSEFGGPERITYAHEFVHALQDQRYDLDEGLGFNDETCEEDSERCAALSSLVEGDATLLEEQWLRTYATSEDLMDLMEYYDALDMQVFERAPRFIQEDLLFPYLSGVEFVRALYDEAGWAGVDQAYLNPPVSTEQILHPDRFPDDVPDVLVVPQIAEFLGSAWRKVDADVLGEWFTRLVLEEFIGTAEAYEAAEGWGGDYYLAFEHRESEQSILVLLSSWDTVRDAHEFAAAFRLYGDARFGERSVSTTSEAAWENGASYSHFYLLGDQTLWILAPDETVAALVRDSVEFPTLKQ